MNMEDFLKSLFGNAYIDYNFIPVEEINEKYNLKLNLNNERDYSIYFVLTHPDNFKQCNSCDRLLDENFSRCPFCGNYRINKISNDDVIKTALDWKRNPEKYFIFEL